MGFYNHHPGVSVHLSHMAARAIINSAALSSAERCYGLLSQHSL